MRKIHFGLWAAVAALMGILTAQAQETYVRKKIKPNFFIPTQEIERPAAKLPQPQFTAGQEETIKVASPEENSEPEATSEAQTPQASTSSQETISARKSEAPAYQQKYQEYLEDIGEVAKGKNLPENQTLNNDLSKMNSEERILVDRQFNRNRQPKTEFNQELKKQLY